MNKEAVIITGIMGAALTTMFIVGRQASSSSDVPLWFTGSQSQIDQLLGSGMSEAEVDHWLDVAYERVYQSLEPGQEVAWDPIMGFYATTSGY